VSHDPVGLEKMLAKNKLITNKYYDEVGTKSLQLFANKSRAMDF